MSFICAWKKEKCLFHVSRHQQTTGILTPILNFLVQVLSWFSCGSVNFYQTSKDHHVIWMMSRNPWALRLGKEVEASSSCKKMGNILRTASMFFYLAWWKTLLRGSLMTKIGTTITCVTMKCLKRPQQSLWKRLFILILASLSSLFLRRLYRKFWSEKRRLWNHTQDLTPSLILL